MEEPMSVPRTYPEGVPCWLDTEQPDLDAAANFYGELFGWTFSEPTPPDATFRYVIAQLDGQDAAGIGARSGESPASEPATVSPGWNTYVAVADIEHAVARVEAAGGSIIDPPSDAGEGGRSASCSDSGGVPFRLWQPKRRLGAQAVNTPGGWNFSDLHSADPAASITFYTKVFGWSFDDIGFGTMIRQPGYGDHLAATSDPGIYERQSGVMVPPGFADAIGWLAALQDGEAPHWHVSFTVASRDDSVAAAERLGATVLASSDDEWTRNARILDPAGALFTVSQFTPPG
jgi:predicted enzyme related to lactoylglutathione lyase